MVVPSHGSSSKDTPVLVEPTGVVGWECVSVSMPCWCWRSLSSFHWLSWSCLDAWSTGGVRRGARGSMTPEEELRTSSGGTDESRRGAGSVPRPAHAPPAPGRERQGVSAET